jgi:hypothetical protein
LRLLARLLHLSAGFLTFPDAVRTRPTAGIGDLAAGSASPVQWLPGIDLVPGYTEWFSMESFEACHVADTQVCFEAAQLAKKHVHADIFAAPKTPNQDCAEKAPGKRFQVIAHA